MSNGVIVEVLETVADVKRIDPIELDYELTDYVDPDAVERLADHDSTSWTLSFELPEHDVTLTGDGLIYVDGDQENTWA